MNAFIENHHPISFFGRPYAELLRCFDVSEDQLRGKSVLDCPAGPSSFVAEANRRGIHAVGVDPLFYRSPDAIAKLATLDFEDMFARVRQSAPERFSPRTYASVDEAEARRREGLELFLEDYRRGYATGRYRPGSLPRLDFEDRAFDVALCAHLLFVYEEKLDFAFHRAAVAELCRVAREEARIHPIVNSRNERYRRLDELVAEARARGFEGSVVRVDHEFFRGANETLVLRRKAARP